MITKCKVPLNSVQPLNTCSNTDNFNVFWFDRLLFEVPWGNFRMNVIFKWFSPFLCCFCIISLKNERYVWFLYNIKNTYWNMMKNYGIWRVWDKWILCSFFNTNKLSNWNTITNSNILFWVQLKNEYTIYICMLQRDRLVLTSNQYTC